MTHIETLLQQVGDYFKEKLISGDYQVTEIGQHTAELLFNDKYRFDVWIANTPPRDFNFYFSLTYPHPLHEGFVMSNDEKAEAWAVLKPHIDKYKKEVLKEQKMLQLEALQREISKLQH